MLIEDNKIWDDYYIVPPIKYGSDEDQVSFSLVIEAGDPSSYKEAIKANDSDKQAMATEQEMESLEKNETQNLVNLSKDLKQQVTGRSFKRRTMSNTKQA